ncbi:MAG: cell division protein SepF [Actinomycetes bacterium]
MAMKDTWNRMLVYFGLAEDHDVAAAYDEYEEEPTSKSAPVRRLPQRRRRDEVDDMFADDSSSDRPAPQLRSVSGGRGSDQRVHLVVPKNFNDAQDVADRFKDGVPVILNLQSADPELSKRMIDFASGLTYALDGGMQQIADKVFLVTPRNVALSAEEKARMIEKGFFNQS